MPIYEYMCSKCGSFEQIEKVNSETTKPCPKCRSISNRVVSNPSPPKFKGKGFYETDYKKNKR